MKYLDLLYEGRYDELVRETFPILETDKDAERAFLRLFLQKQTTMLLNEHTTRHDLFNAAEKGNKYAQYAIARRIYFENEIEEAPWISRRNMKAAAEQGLPDAIAGLAMTYEYGDIGGVDRKEADRLMEQARSLGSELAYRCEIKDWCFGHRFIAPNPRHVIELCDARIAADEAAGIDVNGLWYYYRACAVEALEGRTKAVEDYKRSLDLGVLNAYADLILAFGYDEKTSSFKPSPEYFEYIRQGMAAPYGGAFYLHAVELTYQYDSMEESFKNRDVELSAPYFDLLSKCHDTIHRQLSNAARLGDVAAWELLGDMYHDGSYGFNKHKKKAMVCYEEGIKQDSASCMEKLWKMMHKHEIDKPIDFVDQVALWGARHESKLLLTEVVIAKQEGRLSEFADEIEKYYEPIFDAPEFSLDNDEDWQNTIDDLLADPNDPNPDDYPDDDGRFDAWA